VLDWRRSIDDPLARLTALAKLAYRDIGPDATATESHKTKTKQQFGVSTEEIANGRYDLYAFIEKRSQLKALARHLAKHRYYSGIASIADMLLTADLYPLQTVEGIALPIDLLYYFRRVEDACGLSLQAGLITPI
jgi:glutaredoxin 2